MVLPLLGAILGGGANLAAAFMGAQASREASDTNWDINMYNKRAEDRARSEARAYSEKLRGESKLGQKDAYGNRTYFKEGEGWVTDLSPQQKALMDYFYSKELPEQQSQFMRKANQSRQSDDIASALLNEFRRASTTELPSDVEAQLYAKATRGINESTDSAMEAAMRSAIRGGTSNTGAIAAEIAKGAQKARGEAAQDAAIQARDYVDQQSNKKRNNLSALYQQFLSSANGDLSGTISPTQIAQSATSLMQGASNNGNAADQMGFQATMKSPGKFDYVDPEYGAANALASAGMSLSSMGDRMGSYFDKERNNKLLESFLTQGGQLNFGQGGIFGAMADRVRPNQGFF